MRRKSILEKEPRRPISIIFTILLTALTLCMTSCDLSIKDENPKVYLYAIASDYRENLSGAPFDIIEMENVLKELGTWSGTDVAAEHRLRLIRNLDGNIRAKGLELREIREDLTRYQNIVTENDLFIFYYSGHGGVDGNGQSFLAFAPASPEQNYEPLTASELLETLDSIPGTKVVIIDACRSGGFVQDDRHAFFNSGQDGIRTISDGRTTISLTAAQNNTLHADTYVLASSQSYQDSYDASTQSNGLMTYALLSALGWDHDNGWGTFTDRDGTSTTFKGSFSGIVPIVSRNSEITLGSLFNYLLANTDLTLQTPDMTGGPQDAVLFSF